MNQTRFSTIAHRDHLFCSPLSSYRAEELIGVFDLPTDPRVVDVGCGKGELLLRLVDRKRGQGTGIDPNREFLDVARANTLARGLQNQVTWIEARATDVTLDPVSFDAALCVGALHAYGRFADALAALSALVKPGGLLLVGEGYWKRVPATEYLAFLGASEGDHNSHAGNVDAGVHTGLVPLYSCTSNDDEWDRYEGLYARAMERFITDQPQDPEAAAFRERIRAWREMYLRFGRETLGFGYYLFRRPRPSPQAGPPSGTGSEVVHVA